MPSGVLTKAAPDSRAMTEALIERHTARLVRAFIAAVGDIDATIDVQALEAAIAVRDFPQVFRIVGSDWGRFVRAWQDAFRASGDELAAWVGGNIDRPLFFDPVRQAAVEALQENQLRLIVGLQEAQRGAIREALISGVIANRNPVSVARDIRASIGLTDQQERWAQNYRRQLESQDIAALDRKLRDARFDGSVLRAFSEGQALAPEKIDRMVLRYRERHLAHRAKVIARTEGLAAIHQGHDAMLEQIPPEALGPDEVFRVWNASQDGRERESHHDIHKQEKRQGVPFLSGNGNLLRYPGDPRAPASDRIQCRCVLSVRLRDAASVPTDI